MASVTLSPEHLVHGEIVSVIAAMRKNSRWASYTRYGAGTGGHTNMGVRLGAENAGRGGGRQSRERSLMLAFDDLKREIRDAEDIYQLPLSNILGPFIHLISVPESTGPITLAALNAITNIFRSPLVRPTSVELPAALTSLSTALAKCKFEPSDTSADELVLLKQLDVVTEVVCGSIGNSLGNPEVCELLELVLAMCYQTKHSELLRRTAEYTMHRLIRKVFEKLEGMDPEHEERELEREEAEFKQAASLKAAQSREEAAAIESAEAAQPSQPSDEASLDDNVTLVATEAAQLPAEPALKHAASSPSTSAPYSLITHQSLLMALISLMSTQPPSPPHRMLTSLSLFHTLVLSAPSIPMFPSLLSPLMDTGCRNLFMLIRSDHPGVQALSLKVVTALLEIFGHANKGAYQRELFLNHCLDRLQPPRPLTSNLQRQPSTVSQSPDTRSASPAPSDPDFATQRPPGWLAKGETRDLLLEAITQLARSPSYMVELFVNCDCEANSEDMFEKLMAFLTADVYPTGFGGQETGQLSSQILSLDLLLGFVGHMCARAEGVDEPWPTIYPSPDELLLEKWRKRLLKTGASLFNTKPKNGLLFFEQNGFIHTAEGESKAVSLARFLKNTQRLDKKVLGEYLSSEDNIETLVAFLGLFNFDYKPISDALREVLETFRLPGESGPIGRITEYFAKQYRASKQTEIIKADDAAYILAYSVIMLNTDLHNPQNRKKRMTVEQYTKNLRGVNDGTDFSPEYLESVYESIRKQEIIMPEEHVGQVGFDYAWRELMIRSKTRGPLMNANTSAFDSHLFGLTWRSVISAISYAFVKFDDEYLIPRIIAGLRHCASLSSRFHMHDVFDHIVGLVADATGLILESDLPPAGNFPQVSVQEHDLRITVSPVSITFGRNFKGQLAAVVLFTIVSAHADLLRDEWSQVFEILKTFFLHSLLPSSLLRMEDFLSGSTMIPMKGSLPEPHSAEPPNDGGLLSTLSSYLLTPYGSSVETLAAQPTPEDVDNAMTAIDCIETLNLDSLYTSIMQLEAEPLLAVLRGLQAAANRGTLDKLETRSRHHSHGVQQIPYDPGSVFFLETMISIVIKTSAHINDTWEIVFEHISVILNNADKFSILLVERAVGGLLRLCQVIAEEPKLRDQLYLAFDLLGELSQPIQAAIGEQQMIGLERIIKNHSDIIKSSTEWRLVFALLRPMVGHAEAAKLSFEIVHHLISSTSEHDVTPDNFPMLLLILQDFANTAGLAVAGKPQQARRMSVAEGPFLDAAVPRGMHAIELMFDLKKFIPRLAAQTSLTESEAWETYWLPLLTALQSQSVNTCRDVRHSSINYLQRLLLAPQVADPLDDQRRLFDRVVFPLLDELLKPQIYLRDPHGMSETRLRASNLLCKTFLHYGIQMYDANQDITELWIRILDYLDRFMNSGKRDQLYEAVPESLKNVVLVLHSSNILVPPSPTQDPRQQKLWTATQQRMGRFLPSFLEDLVPTAGTSAPP